jgi:hypothetical protein
MSYIKVPAALSSTLSRYQYCGSGRILTGSGSATLLAILLLYSYVEEKLARSGPKELLFWFPPGAWSRMAVSPHFFLKLFVGYKTQKDIIIQFGPITFIVHYGVSLNPSPSKNPTWSTFCLPTEK